MDRLACLDTFVNVVDKGGFTAAARHLNLAPSTVSQQIQILEKRLQARLLHRTTRSCRLTEVGRTFYERCVSILGDIEEAEVAATTLHSTSRGMLRLNVSPMLANHVVALVGEYTTKHPQTSFELITADQMGGLVEGGFDLAIRADALPDSSLISRRLGCASWSPCASPGYLAQRGDPFRPADLAAHNCLIYAPHWGDGQWCFTDGDAEHRVQVSGTMRSNDPGVLRTAALSSQGVSLLPDIAAAPDLAAGRLVRVLRGYSVQQTAVYAVFPSGRQIPQKVRGFVDFAIGRFAPPRRPADQPRQAEFATPAPDFAHLAFVEPESSVAWPVAATSVRRPAPSIAAASMSAQRTEAPP